MKTLLHLWVIYGLQCVSTSDHTQPQCQNCKNCNAISRMGSKFKNQDFQAHRTSPSASSAPGSQIQKHFCLPKGNMREKMWKPLTSGQMKAVRSVVVDF